MSEFSAQEQEPHSALSEREKDDLGRIGLNEESLEKIFHESPENHGTVATTFVTRQNGEDLVLKRHGKEVGQDQSIDREHVILRLLRRTGSPHSPELRAFIPSQETLVETKALGEPPKEFNGKLIQVIAQALGEIHQPIFNKYGKPLENRKAGNQHDFLLDGIGDLSERAQTTPGLPEKLRSSLLGVINNNKTLAGKSPNAFAGESFSLIHFDLNPSNILWDPKKESVTLIDWGSASIGDPAMDIAKFFLKCDLNSDQARDFLQTYEHVNPDSGLEDRLSIYHDLVRVNSLLWRYGYIHKNSTAASSQDGIRQVEVVQSKIQRELQDLGITKYD